MYYSKQKLSDTLKSQIYVYHLQKAPLMMPMIEKLHLKTNTTMSYIRQDLVNAATVTQERAKRFFDMRPGGYAEHDQFLGVPVPAIRKLTKKYTHLSFEQISLLITSPYNEERLFALLILVARYPKGSLSIKEQCYQMYMSHLAHVNNWNLVDSSAHHILGAYTWNKDTSILVQLARSNDLWERRIAIVATWYFIRNNRYDVTCTIAQSLLQDKHDLIHKAVGWMLREMGKKDRYTLCTFLNKNVSLMPRTMLRYAIEKLSQEQRKHYLAL